MMKIPNGTKVRIQLNRSLEWSEEDQTLRSAHAHMQGKVSWFSESGQTYLVTFSYDDVSVAALFDPSELIFLEPMHPDVSRGLGYIIDDTCYPWIGYKGDRFGEGCLGLHKVYTDLESELLRELGR